LWQLVTTDCSCCCTTTTIFLVPCPSLPIAFCGLYTHQLVFWRPQGALNVCQAHYFIVLAHLLSPPLEVLCEEIWLWNLELFILWEEIRPWNSVAEDDMFNWAGKWTRFDLPFFLLFLLPFFYPSVLWTCPHLSYLRLLPPVAWETILSIWSCTEPLCRLWHHCLSAVENIRAARWNSGLDIQLEIALIQDCTKQPPNHSTTTIYSSKDVSASFCEFGSGL
jgi:hypothetical protein